MADKKKTTLDKRTPDTLADIRALHGTTRRKLAVGITTLPNPQKHGPLNPIWHSATTDKPLRLVAPINGRPEHGGG